VECIELVEPRVELRHALAAFQFVSDGALCECRHVQPRAPRELVEIVGETDVPPGHRNYTPA